MARNPDGPPPDANGPFQVEGRLGTCTVRREGDWQQLCLWPAAPGAVIGAQRAHELFAEGACYWLNPHQVGDTWTENNDPDNRTYKMWLVKGR